MKLINEIYAFIAEDPKEEGVIGANLMPGMFMPFVGADKARMESLRPYAEEIARKSGKTIRLVKFSNREVLDTIGKKTKPTARK